MDIPVYRLPEEKYYKEMEIFVEKEKIKYRLHEENENYKDVIILWRNQYGGPWEFNEIIGWIRYTF